jgi:HAD superfamily hydrolase (TIGR01484 family)
VNRRLLICTDLDRTLLPNGEAPESVNARPTFCALAAHPGITLAYVSGRDLGLVEQAIAEYAVPIPDVVIADVGTSIYHRAARDAWRRDRLWDETLARDWHGAGHAGLAARLDPLDGLERQEAERQGRHKLSYYLPPGTDADALDRQVEAQLAGIGARTRRIYSVDDLDGRGLLDVLPASASKYHAIRALMQELAFSLDDTVFCGDSGNDLDVLASPIHAVLVANATAQVRAQAVALAADRHHADALYLAHGGFMGMNGNYSAGILEGAAHYQPHIVHWIARHEEERT